jgi:hypothetical protein
MSGGSYLETEHYEMLGSLAISSPTFVLFLASVPGAEHLPRSQRKLICLL